MKVLKKRFGLTKEEVEKNVRFLPYHKLYLETTEKIVILGKDKGLANTHKLRAIRMLQDNLRNEWKKLDDKV